MRSGSRRSGAPTPRDAADAAITTTFGPNTLENFSVWTDEVKVERPA